MSGYIPLINHLHRYWLGLSNQILNSYGVMYSMNATCRLESIRV